MPIHTRPTHVPFCCFSFSPCAHDSVFAQQEAMPQRRPMSHRPTPHLSSSLSRRPRANAPFHFHSPPLDKMEENHQIVATARTYTRVFLEQASNAIANAQFSALSAKRAPRRLDNRNNGEKEKCNILVIFFHLTDDLRLTDDLPPPSPQYRDHSKQFGYGCGRNAEWDYLFFTFRATIAGGFCFRAR